MGRRDKVLLAEVELDMPVLSSTLPSLSVVHEGIAYPMCDQVIVSGTGLPICSVFVVAWKDGICELRVSERIRFVGPFHGDRLLEVFLIYVHGAT
jgi:hypothetical protein